jgi:hypothetical protein
MIRGRHIGRYPLTEAGALLRGGRQTPPMLPTGKDISEHYSFDRRVAVAPASETTYVALLTPKQELVVVPGCPPPCTAWNEPIGIVHLLSSGSRIGFALLILIR